MDGHKMTEAAQYKVGSRFAEHNIELHIDAHSTPMNRRFISILGNRFPTDGGDMGGGEDVISEKDETVFYYKIIYKY